MAEAADAFDVGRCRFAHEIDRITGHVRIVACGSGPIDR